MPCATSPSAMPFTSSTCSPQKAAICSKVSDVFATSQTAVALGINGLRSLMTALISGVLRARPQGQASSR